MLSYIAGLNLISLGIKHRLKVIKIMQTKKMTRLLPILVKCGIIFGWTTQLDTKKKYYIVYLNFYSNKNIYNIYKNNRQLFFRTKQLFKLNKRYSSNTVFLSTSSGVLSLYEACLKKQGGFLFFQIL